jgi:hypothetical protein
MNGKVKKMIEYKIDGCRNLTNKDNGLCLFHDYKYDLCKYFYCQLLGN